MREIPQSEIVERLKSENTWWMPPYEIEQDRKDARRRAYLEPLMSLIQAEQPNRAVVVLGPRRVGKTWLMHHAIQNLLESGVPPQKIGYVSIDSPAYNHLRLEKLVELLKQASGAESSEGCKYVFFDEIQYLKEWERDLKVLVDKQPDIKFVASGSAAAALKMKSRESGAGRFTDFLLPPLTFHEYLHLLDLEESLIEQNKDTDHIYRAKDIDGLNDAFLEYLNFGGYPEVIFSKEIQKDPSRFVKSDIIDKVLLRDLPSLYGISDIQELNYLFTTLAYNTSGEVSPRELSQSAGVAKNTLKKYIEYLEAAFLIRTVHRVDLSGKRFKRVTRFKVYLTNPSIRAALFAPVPASDTNTLGALAETAIYAQWFHSNAPPFYARWDNGEIDLVGHDGVKPKWAVEVKWSDRCWDNPSVELRRLVEFSQRNDVSATCTTRSKRGERIVDGVPILFYPSSEYCYTVGRNLLKRKHSTGEEKPSVTLFDQEQ